MKELASAPPRASCLSHPHPLSLRKNWHQRLPPGSSISSRLQRSRMFVEPVLPSPPGSSGANVCRTRASISPRLQRSRMFVEPVLPSPPGYGTKDFEPGDLRVFFLWFLFVTGPRFAWARALRIPTQRQVGKFGKAPVVVD